MVHRNLRNSSSYGLVNMKCIYWKYRLTLFKFNKQTTNLTNSTTCISLSFKKVKTLKKKMFFFTFCLLIAYCVSCLYTDSKNIAGGLKFYFFIDYKNLFLQYFNFEFYEYQNSTRQSPHFLSNVFFESCILHFFIPYHTIHLYQSIPY